MTKKKQYAEFDIPTLITEAITEYLGPRKLNKLTSDQRSDILFAANQCAVRIGIALEGREVPKTEDEIKE